MSKFMTRIDGVSQRVGREIKLTNKVARILYRALAVGTPRQHACALAKINSATFRRWLQLGAEHEGKCEFELPECTSNCGDSAAFRAFYRNVKKAEGYCVSDSLQQIKRIGRKEWTANAWILERRFKEDFGKELVVSHSGEVNHNHKVSLDSTTPEQKKRMAAALIAQANFDTSHLLETTENEDGVYEVLETPQDTEV